MAHAHKPFLSPSQFDRLSNIFDNAGQGLFVLLVLTPVIAGFDKVNLWVLILSILSVLFCWTVSLILARRADEERL